MPNVLDFLKTSGGNVNFTGVQGGQTKPTGSLASQALSGSPLSFLKQDDEEKKPNKKRTLKVAEPKKQPELKISQKTLDADANEKYADQFFNVDNSAQTAVIDSLFKKASAGDNTAIGRLNTIQRRYQAYERAYEKAQTEKERNDKKSTVSKIGEFVVGGDDNRNLGQNVKSVATGFPEAFVSTYEKAGNKLAIAMGIEQLLRAQRDKGEISDATYRAELERLAGGAGLNLDDSGSDVFRKSAANFGEIAADALTFGTASTAEKATTRVFGAALEGSAGGILNSLQDDEITAANIVKGGTAGAFFGTTLGVALPITIKGLNRALKASGETLTNLGEEGFLRVSDDLVVTPDAGDYAKAKVAGASDVPTGRKLFEMQDVLTEHSFPTDRTGTKIENAGDIYRELAKLEGNPVSRAYIGEKFYKIKNAYGLEGEFSYNQADVAEFRASTKEIPDYNAKMDAWQERLNTLEEATKKYPDGKNKDAMLATLDMQRDIAEWHRNPTTNFSKLQAKIKETEKLVYEVLDEASNKNPSLFKDEGGFISGQDRGASDTGKIFYHGTANPNLKSIKDLQAGSKVGTSGRNRIYVTENPEIAKNFGNNVISERLYGKHLDVRDIGIERTPGWAPDNVVSPEFADYKTTNLLTEREKRVFENQFVKGVPRNTIIEDTPGIHKYIASKGYTTVTIPRTIDDVSGARSETIIISDRAFSSPKANKKPSLFKDEVGSAGLDIRAPETLAEDAASIIEDIVSPQKTTDTLTTPVEQGAKTVQEQLVRQLDEWSGYTTDPALRKALGLTDLSLSGDVNFWLKQFGDTTTVAGRYFGKFGTDSMNLLAKGAKTVADLQEIVGPLVKENRKLLDKAAKSSVGRKNVNQHIFLALGDRQNASRYLQTDIERQLFDNTVQIFDIFKKKREDLGLNVIGENYRPEVMVREALEAPEKMFNSMRNKFNTDVESPFSKERVPDADIDIETNILDMLPQYVASQAREFGYKPAMDFMLDNVDKINLASKADRARFSAGKDYMATVISQALNHTPSSKFQRLSNQVLANTYKNVLGYRPKFYLQNVTQRFLTKAEVGSQAWKLRKSIPDDVIQSARRNVVTGLNPISGEFPEIAAKTKKNYDFAFKSEEGNVIGAFDAGFTQGIIDSPVYKQAIEAGSSPEDAIRLAAKDESSYGYAIRYGNKVVNDTQFGANAVTKPLYFRNRGQWFGVIPDVWFKQYHRFAAGMTENLSRVMNIKNARALDILKVGDPRFTPIPEYRDAAKLMSNAVDDVITGIKRGEIHDVPLEIAEGYKKHLTGLIDHLDKEVANISPLRRGKSAQAYIKMWVALTGIQFLFDGGLFSDGEETDEKLAKAAVYGSPVNVPTKEDNPFEIAAPSSPINSQGGVDAGKLLNLVPGVGLAYNRYNDIKNFFNLD